MVNRNLDIPLPVSLSVKYFTPKDIKFAIKKYDLKKSPCYDLITAEVARCLLKRAIVLLTFILNASLRMSYFPFLWKLSTIILIHKPNKHPDMASSYRHISLLPFFVKIFEKFILKRILPYIFYGNILSNIQFGFRATRSTTHQLHRLIDVISYSLEKKKNIALVFFLIFPKHLIGCDMGGSYLN